MNFVTDMGARARAHPLDRLAPSDQGFEPPTDIYETTDAIVVRMELAGVDPSDIELWVDEDAGHVTVRGRREDPAGPEQRRYYSVEIECGSFVRVIQLPRGVVSEAVAASYGNGFLVVRLPKGRVESSAPRSVPIE